MDTALKPGARWDGSKVQETQLPDREKNFSEVLSKLRKKGLDLARPNSQPCPLPIGSVLVCLLSLVMQLRGWGRREDFLILSTQSLAFRGDSIKILQLHP